MTKICIFGAGAIGGYLACSLKKTSADVSIIARGEHKKIIELLEKTSGYSKQTKSTQLKKEFQLLVDQYFPYKADEE